MNRQLGYSGVVSGPVKVEGDIKNPKTLLANANLGIAPGRAVGEALRHLLDRVLEDPSLNTPAALESEIVAWWSARAASAGTAS